MKTETIRIGGMTCVNCQNRIERQLRNTAGVEAASADYNAGTATVTWDPSILTLAEIEAAIEKLDYKVLKTPALAVNVSASEIAGIVIIIFALFMLLRMFGISAITTAFPLAETGMGYGMLFVIGLVTSVHCAAMCGGINLSQTLKGEGSPPKPPAGIMPLLPAILYNAGRVISYTVIGIVVGALGSVLTISGRFQGIVQLIAGVFMVIMGVNMLGIFQGTAGNVLRRLTPRLPKIFAKKIGAHKTVNKSPLAIGLLNGFMPCGPLQAMQIYALSTGSPVTGGLSMFLFSAGTVPLMFGIGALSTLLSAKFTRTVMRAGAILVTVMGLTMFSYGWNLSGFNFNLMAAKENRADGAFIPAVQNGVQIINSTLSSGSYPAITVQQGIPVKWTINAPQGSINGCNNRMIIREYGIEHRFRTGDNVIEFIPAKTGRFSYSCWMGMIRSSITVVDEGQSMAGAGGLNPVPALAGVAISTDTIALAEIKKEESAGLLYQTITSTLRDEGMDPGIIIVQRGLPALWTINNDSLDPGNSSLIFPAYRTRIEMKQGENGIRLMPMADFDFSTADNVFYSFVKVVDDLADVDIEAVKAEAGSFETMIYPDVYFDTEPAAGCCN